MFALASRNLDIASMTHARWKHARAAALLVAVTLSALAFVALAGCNTTQGVGEDIESLGDGISDTARDAKN
jgi:predicted small secreted protein